MVIPYVSYHIHNHEDGSRLGNYVCRILPDHDSVALSRKRRRMEIRTDSFGYQIDYFIACYSDSSGTD